VRFHTLPGPRVVRARAAAPINFRRGDPSFARGSETLASDRKRAKHESGSLGRSTSGLQFPPAVRSPSRSHQLCRSPAALAVVCDPALGFASLRVSGTIDRAPPGIRCRSHSNRRGFEPTRTRSGADHQPPAGCRRTHWRRADPSARGLWNVLPDRPAPAEHPPTANRPRDSPHSRRGGVRPFSVFEGLMPRYSGDGFSPAPQRLPV